MAIAECMLRMNDGDEVDAFWMAKRLYEKLNCPVRGEGDVAIGPRDGEDIMKRLCALTHDALASGQDTAKLYSHLDKIGVAQELPLSVWFGRGFAGVLSDDGPLQKLWDKVAGGSVIVLVHVAVAFVEASKTALLGCQTPKEAIRCLTSVWLN